MARTLNCTVEHGGVIYDAGTPESKIDNPDGITAAGVWDGRPEAKAPSTPKVPTIAEILDEVGEDPAKAKDALDAENARDEDDRRDTLLKKLQAVIDAGSSGS